MVGLNIRIIYYLAIMSIVEYTLFTSFCRSLIVNADEESKKRRENILKYRNLNKIGANLKDIARAAKIICIIIAIMFSMYQICIERNYIVSLFLIVILYASVEEKNIQSYKRFSIAGIYAEIIINTIIACNAVIPYTQGYVELTLPTRVERLLIWVIFVDIFIIILFEVYNAGRRNELAGSVCGVLIFVAAVQTVIIMLVNDIFADNIKNEKCVFIIWLMFIAGNILLVLIVHICTNIRNDYEENVLKIELETNRKLYNNILDAKEELRDIRHDLKNRLNLLSYQLELGNYDAVKKELDNILDNINKAGRPDYCENLEVNSIFAYKLSNVPEKVKLVCNIDVPLKMETNYGDMSVLIGNLIDNSINAVERIKDKEQAYIDINLTCSAGNVIFSIKNNYNNEKQVRSKDYYINHGRGIGSVKKIIKKYNGSYESKHTDKEYETCIIVPMYKVDI